MAQSLKTRYEIRKLQEKVQKVDRQRLDEQRTARLIIEAMDHQDLEKVSAIIQKLETIKNAAGDDIRPLTAGIEQAQAELNKYTSGGPLVKAWTDIKDMVGIDNPIVKITTFANALERGFWQLPMILKNNGLDAATLKKYGDPDKMTLANAIAQQFIEKPDAGRDSLKKTMPNEATLHEKGAESPTSVFDSPSISSQDINARSKADNSPKTQAKIKSVIAQMQKALSPGGVFGAFKKVPYVSSAELAQALINAQLSTLVNVSNAVRSGPQTKEIAADMRSNISGGGGEAGADHGKPTGETTPPGQSATTEPSKSTTGSVGSAPTGQTPPKGPGEKRGGGRQQRPELDPGLIKHYQGRLKDVNADAVDKVIRALHAGGQLISH